MVALRDKSQPQVTKATKKKKEKSELHVCVLGFKSGVLFLLLWFFFFTFRRHEKSIENSLWIHIFVTQSPWIVLTHLHFSYPQQEHDQCFQPKIKKVYFVGKYRKVSHFACFLFYTNDSCPSVSLTRCALCLDITKQVYNVTMVFIPHILSHLLK